MKVGLDSELFEMLRSSMCNELADQYFRLLVVKNILIYLMLEWWEISKIWKGNFIKGNFIKGNFTWNNINKTVLDWLRQVLNYTT